jgi:hypothetical protein
MFHNSKKLLLIYGKMYWFECEQDEEVVADVVQNIDE